MLKISVAICTYNGERYIKDQLKSILDQDRRVDEIVICDDGSTDNTVLVCNNILLHSGIKYTIVENKENFGFIKNFYQAMSLCKNDIIFLCDQDDVWLRNKTSVILDVFEKNSTALMVFSNAIVTNDKLEPINDLYKTLNYSASYLENQNIAFEKLLNDNFVVGATAAIRKDLLNMANDLDNEWAHDSWLAVVASLNKGLYSIDDSLIYYRQHATNTIGINQQSELRKLKKILKKIFSSNMDQYACIRVPLLLHLKKYMENRYFEKENYLKLEKSIEFWNKRLNFSKNNIFQNIIIVLIGAFKEEQKKNRNIKRPVLVDLINAILIARK